MLFLFETLALLGILYWAPWFGDIDAESRLVAAALGAAVLAGCLNWIFDLARAPVEMDRERALEIARLKGHNEAMATAIRDADKAEAAVAELVARYHVGASLFRHPSSGWPDAMRAWERDLDIYVEKTFKPGFLHQIRLVDFFDYTAVHERGTVRTMEFDRTQNDRTYFAERLRKLADLIPYAETYYRGDLGGLALQRALLDIEGAERQKSPPPPKKH